MGFWARAQKVDFRAQAAARGGVFGKERCPSTPKTSVCYKQEIFDQWSSLKAAKRAGKSCLNKKWKDNEKAERSRRKTKV